jgi:hypothetical protein
MGPRRGVHNAPVGSGGDAHHLVQRLGEAITASTSEAPTMIAARPGS